MPKVGTKNAMFWYFWARTLKNYCHICYRHPQICLIAHFFEKKPEYIWLQNALFGYFWVRIFKKYCCI